MAMIIGVFDTEEQAEKCLGALGPGGTTTDIKREQTVDGKIRLMVATPDAGANHIGNVLRRCGAQEVFVGLEGEVRREIDTRH